MPSNWEEWKVVFLKNSGNLKYQSYYVSIKSIIYSDPAYMHIKILKGQNVFG